MRKAMVAGLLGIVALAGCAAPASRNSQEIAAIDEVWAAAYNSGDFDTLEGLYAENCRILPPNAELQEGRASARAVFAEMAAAGLKVELESVEAVVAADIGYRVGTYVLHTSDGQEADRGKYIETWRQIGDKWQITNDIWNSDLPPPLGTAVTVTHEVEDAQRWLAAWRGPDSRHQLMAQHGAPRARVFQSADNPNLTGLVLEVEDMEAFQAFMESEEVASAKAEDGVKEATLRIFNQVQ